MTAAVVRDHAKALLHEKVHLPVPARRHSAANHARIRPVAAAPVLKENLGAVSGDVVAM